MIKFIKQIFCKHYGMENSTCLDCGYQWITNGKLNIWNWLILKKHD